MITAERTQDMETTPTVNEELLNFLDYTILLLSQANTVDEIDLIMDDFMSEDIIHVFSENNLIFNIIPIVWLNTYKRVIHASSSHDFPLKLLWLPILFKNLGWELNGNSELQIIYGEALSKLEEDLSLFNMLNILFLEGLLGKFSSAYSNFNRMCSKLNLTDQEGIDLENIKTDIRELGW